MKYFLQSFSPFHLFKKGSSVSGETMCWLVLAASKTLLRSCAHDLKSVFEAAKTNHLIKLKSHLQSESSLFFFLQVFLFSVMNQAEYRVHKRGKF